MATAWNWDCGGRFEESLGDVADPHHVAICYVLFYTVMECTVMECTVLYFNVMECAISLVTIAV